jgi:hypothetical protein
MPPLAGVELDTAELVVRRGEEAVETTSTRPRSRLKENLGRGTPFTHLAALATLSRSEGERLGPIQLKAPLRTRGRCSGVMTTSSARSFGLVVPPQQCFGQCGIVREVGERDLRLDHPELGEVAAGVRVLGAERRPEGVSFRERQAIPLHVELPYTWTAEMSLSIARPIRAVLSRVGGSRDILNNQLTCLLALGVAAPYLLIYAVQ